MLTQDRGNDLPVGGNTSFSIFQTRRSCPVLPSTFLMSIASNNLSNKWDPVLSADQERACERLLGIARVRAITTEDALPTGMLSHWSVPLLVGPAGVGKAFTCVEVARRWGDKPYRRWDVSGWTLVAHRTTHNTSEQIRTFIAGNPDGCIVYLAGIDALAVANDYHASHTLAVADEIAQFLSQATARPTCFPGRDGSVLAAKVLVVVGGSFGPLWREVTVGSNSDCGEAWRLADAAPLTDAHSVAPWLWEESCLPVSILRRLAPEPLVVRGLNDKEADQLARRLHARLPPSFDGLDADEFRQALVSPSGWRAVAALVEASWVMGHTLLTSDEAGESLPAPPETQKRFSQLEQLASNDPKLAKLEPITSLLPAKLGTRLGIPSSRSRLISKARRLGLRTAGDLESLACAREYLLPSENTEKAATWERVSRSEFSDSELLAALLSPCLEWSEQAICRGALMVATLLPVIAPEAIVYEARRARGEIVLRHVAWIGAQLHPLHRCWRDLLLVLPSIKDTPTCVPGVMPDEAIRRILAASRH